MQMRSPSFFCRNNIRHTKFKTTKVSMALQMWVLVICLGVIPGWFAFPAQAQEGVAEAQPEVEYAFGEQITFRVQFPSDISIQAVEVFFQANSDPTVVEAATLTEEAWVYTHDVKARYVRAFSTVTYWFRVMLETGETQETTRFSFFYEDNRFNWQTLEGVPFRVHWYEGEVGFTQAVLDVARAGAQQAGLILDAEFSETVEIYIYGNLTDYQFARDVMAPQWAGGHADPDTGIIVVSLPPGENQMLEVERKIPHEVAHLMLYAATGEGFGNLPAWLNEGFASTQERNPNPDYDTLSRDAVKNGTLIPLAVLCQPFPRDAASAVLAYAEATTFVRYLQTRFGQEGVRAVVTAYANGAGCEQGTNITPVNLPLSQLEREWREGELAENVTVTALREMTPLLILLGVIAVGPVLVIVGFRRPQG
ncbi:MAG: hypothetical protein Fur0022_41110 [Anaerolineales bacterium]